MEASKDQAGRAVSGVLANILPGFSIETRKARRHESGAQVVKQTMKQRVAVRERDRLQEKERLRRQRQRAEREARQQASQAEQEAKLAALERHQETGRLTKEEKRYLNKRTRQGAARARTWDLDEDEADEAAALQSQILDRIGSASGAGRVRKQRRARIREALPKASEDRRYAGLTPGLAPVGMSDEESSDEELSDEED